MLLRYNVVIVQRPRISLKEVLPMNITLSEVEEFDARLVASIKEKQQQIDEEVKQIDVKITDVLAYRVLMPWLGTKRDDASAQAFTFYEFHTDKGLVGLRESGGVLAEEGLKNLKDKVVGKSPFDELIRQDLDTAYWDIVGKALKKPLHEYLSAVFGQSPPYRKMIPVAAYTWHRFPDLNGEGEVNFENYHEHCQQLIKEHGFKVIKLSVVDYEPMRYIELIHRIREVLGDNVDIRIDTHGSWNAQTALDVLKGVEACHLEYIKTPVGGPLDYQFRSMHRLRMMTTIPFSSHSWLPPFLPRPGGSTTLDQKLDLKLMGKYDPADISAPDAYVGPLAMKRIYDVAKFVGMGCTQHSGYEMGVNMMFRLHISAFSMPYQQNPRLATWSGPIPGLLHALDAHYNQWKDDVLKGGKMKYIEGFLCIPDKPGLGIELDTEKLKEYEYAEEMARRHASYDKEIKERYVEATGWIHERNGWPRYTGRVHSV